MVTKNQVKKLPNDPQHEAYTTHLNGAKADNIGAYGQPIACTDAYKDNDREMVAEIVDWFAAQNNGETDPKKLKTQAWLGRLARINTSTVSQILKGKYPSSPTKQLRAMLGAIEDFGRKQESGSTMRYVHTGIYRSIASACQRASPISTTQCVD